MTAGSGRGLFDVCFTSLCDWPQNSCHFLNQSGIKGKPITSWLRMFSRAWGSQVGFTLSSHWLLKFYLPLFWLAVDIILVLVFHEYLNIRLNFKKNLVELIAKLQVYRNVIGWNTQVACLRCVRLLDTVPSAVEGVLEDLIVVNL